MSQAAKMVDNLLSHFDPSKGLVQDLSFEKTFRKRLKDFISTSSGEWSLRKIAAAAGLSVGSLSLFMTGKRDLSWKASQKILSTLPLNDKDRHVLELLWAWSYSHSPEKKLSALRQLCRMKPFKEVFKNEIEYASYLSDWLHVTLRELCQLKNFRLDISWIQKRLCFFATPTDVRRALRFLKEKNFVSVDADGRVIVRDKAISCRGQFFLLTMNSFHQTMLELAKQSIARRKSSERYVEGITFAVSKAALPRVNEVLRQAIQKIHQISEECSEPEMIFQAECLAFPLVDTTTEVDPKSNRRKV